MKVILHCQVYWPDNTAVSQMMTAVAEDTARAGHTVTVVTSARGYNQSETYPRAEVHHGVNILRVGGGRMNRHSALGRLFNYLTFILFSSWRVLRLPRPDCLMVTSVPPFSLGLGVLLKWRRQTSVVYVIEDLYPDILFASGLLRQNSLLGKFLSGLFGRGMNRVSAIIVLGDFMKQRLLAAYPRLAGKNVHPIHNWQDGSQLFPIERARAADAPVVFQYSGNFGKAHDFKTLLGAARRLQGATNLRFEFIGGGKHREFVEQEIRAGNLSSCRVSDYVPQTRLNESLNQADVCLVTLGAGYEGLIVPSKIYGIMAVGRPVLYIGPAGGEIPDLVRRHELGWVVSPGDENRLVEVIQEAVRRPELRKQYGNNARRAFDEFYERKIATTNYVRVFESCVNG